MAHDNPTPPAFDPNDPHGFHADDDHGHVIIPNRVLIGVLLVLLTLTFATVGAALLETWIAETLDVTLPWWVNIVVALSIATVKGILVLAIFMQLWFDNKLNLVAFATCLICVALFMGFTVGDRATRGALHKNNKAEFTQGGTGFGLNYDELVGVIETPEGEKVNTSGLAIAEVARLRAINEIYAGDEKAFKAAKAAKHHHHGHLPSADHTTHRAGVTAGLFDLEAPSKDKHVHDEHGGEEHHDDDHAEHQAEDHGEDDS